MIFIFGYIPHFRSYTMPFIQFPSILIITLSFFLQIILFIGAIFIDHFSEMELLAMFLIASIALTFYYLILKRILVLESLQICRSESFTHIRSQENFMIPKGYSDSFDEMEDLTSNILRNESQERESSINGTQKTNSPDDFQRKCLLYIFLRMHRFRHVKYFRCIFSDSVFNNEDDFDSFTTKIEALLWFCCVSLVLIFSILLILTHLHQKPYSVVIALGAAKFIILVIYLYAMSFLMGNLGLFFRKERTLYGKFNCVRLIFFCFLIQNIIISCCGIRNALGLSLNFLISSTENCILSYFWIKYYGVWACSHKAKGRGNSPKKQANIQNEFLI